MYIECLHVQILYYCTHITCTYSYITYQSHQPWKDVSFPKEILWLLGAPNSVYVYIHYTLLCVYIYILN